MKLHAIILAATLAASASGALAGPVLRSEVTVNHPIVTVGDMFEDAGSFAERAMFRAPAPGTTGTVTLEAVREAASLIGLTDYDAEGVLRVRVARASVLIDEPILTELITADLAERGIVRDGIVVNARFDQPPAVFHAEAVDDPVQLVSLRYTPSNEAFAARFLIAGHDKPVDLSGRVELMIEAPHLAATRPAGAILQPVDIEMRLVPLAQAESSGVATLEQLIGKQLMRQSRGGLMLRTTDVTEPRVIERNAMVTVILNAGPMTLTVKGQALNNAAVGEPVQVLNAVTRRILFGTALSTGAVAIVSSIDVAGL